jgi:hypothetical protein
MSYYSACKPTIWNRLGFREAFLHRPEEDEYEEGYAHSWFTTETYAHFCFVDRLRILLSGNIHVHCSIKTDAAIHRSRAISAVAVMAPGKLKR